MSLSRTLLAPIAVFAVIGAFFVSSAGAAGVTRSLDPKTMAGPASLTYDDRRLHEPVPFQLVRGVHPVVAVRVNGRTLHMLIDSGATAVHVPPVPGGGDIALLSSLCFANDVCFRSIMARATATAYTQERAGYINGLIGYNVLSALDITIDYANRQLVFGQAPGDDAARVPVSPDGEDRRPFGQGEIGGRAIENILFDTGSSFVRVRPDLVEQMGPAATPAASEVAWSIRGSETSQLLQVDRMCAAAAACVSGELAQVGDWQAIGGSLFRHFRVTIGEGGGAFFFEPNAAPANFESMREKWGFQVDLTDASRIVQVEPASPAAAAGLSAGDVLTAVEGRPVSALGYIGVHALLEDMGRSTVSIGVGRGGQQVEVSLELH